MTTYQNILNYWYKLEYFSPFWPANEESADKFKYPIAQPFPWEQDPEHPASYNVFLGEVSTDDLILNMIRAIGEEDERLEKDRSKNCICGFKLTNDGKYVKGSYSVATFVWAIAKITEYKTNAVNISDADLKLFNVEIDEHLGDIGVPITTESLNKVLALTCSKLKIDKPNLTGLIFEKEPIDPENATDEVQIDMIPSFYTEDLKLIRNNFSKTDRIGTYINGAVTEQYNRIEIDNNIEEMKKWVSIEKYPIGKWPSKNSPSLMQQLSINLAIQDGANSSNIFSVNGPPGTGKTTLLKEIIAHNLVERALKLAQYANPDNAFEKQLFEQPPNEYLQTYYKLDRNLTKYGVIIASNNNAAVENISKELPVAKSVADANTDLFQQKVDKDVYFTELAGEILNEESWGLISARLGKKSNINDFAQKIWFAKDVKNLRNYFDSPLDWNEAKKAFHEKYEEFIQHRSIIATKIEEINSIKYIQGNIKRLEDHLQKNHIKEQEQKNKIVALTDDIQLVEKQIETLTESENQLKNRIPWYKKIFISYFKNDPMISEYFSLKEKINTLVLLIPAKKQDANNFEATLKGLKQESTTIVSKLNEQNIKHEATLKKIDQYKVEFGVNFAGDEFWQDIEGNEQSQGTSPWTTKQFDILREELFYLALQVHKAFITNSRSIRQNLNALINMWKGEFSTTDQQIAFGTLLNTLLLVVPVVSTTFASVGRFLKYANKEELGILVVDESGQATPQSALGAIWRTQKAIIVGDPLQVEPVLTIPKQLIHTFADNLNVPVAYRSTILSVQQLADNINRYGGYRTTNNGKIWLGCPLVVHRRCIEPMFSISNKIAYNNRMFIKTAYPQDNTQFLFESSRWIDVKGSANGGKNNFVLAQGIEVLNLVATSIQQNNKLPNLYIISPFKTVMYEMKKLLRAELPKLNLTIGNDENLNEWIKNCCGTVHTFQGKEANEVILLLGCDHENGDGAANWASAKPNILNVAATRAKYRLAIVGDINLWKDKDGFDLAYDLLR